MKISCRASSIKPSATLAITAKSKKLASEGKDVISFGAGEPDFDTPEYIKNAVKDALDRGHTKYTPVSGIDELKTAIGQKFLKDYNVRYDNNEILVSCGGKHALFNVFSALLDEGEEIIVPSPYWVSYTEIIKLSGGVPVIADTSSNRFKFTLEMLKKNLSPKSRGVIINSPSNPTGVLMDEKDIMEIADFVKSGKAGNDFYIISDDIYEKIIFDGKRFFNVLMSGRDMKNHTIAVNAVSKTYSMTGFRIGYTAAPKELISAMNSIQSQSTSNPTTFSQYGALAALKGGEDFTLNMRNEFEKRRDFMVDFLGKNVKSLKPVIPDGAFYLFVDISDVFKKSGERINSSSSFCDYLLEDYLVAAVPGAEFGNDNFIRLSFAASMDMIKKGLERIREAISWEK